MKTWRKNRTQYAFTINGRIGFRIGTNQEGVNSCETAKGEYFTMQDKKNADAAAEKQRKMNCKHEEFDTIYVPEFKIFSQCRNCGAQFDTRPWIKNEKQNPIQ